MNDAIIERIRKLMALTTERGASEAEAAIAAGHVQRLLAEHNLSMAVVEAGGASSGAGGKRTREGVGRRQVYKWQRTLMGSIAELNYCKAFVKWLHKPGRANVFNGYELIGRVDNVTSSRVMFEYLIETIERLAREDVGGDPTQYFTRYAHSFKEGCADRIVERLRDEQRRIVEEQEQQAKAEQARRQHPSAAPSNLPVVFMSDVLQTEKDLNQDFEHGWEPGTTARKRQKNAEYVAAQEQKARDLTAAGYPPDVAYFMSVGYDEARARQLAEPTPQKPETDAQRRKREERADRDNDRYWEREHARQHREAQRLDRGAYRKGAQAGDGVSLNRQVDKDEKRRLS